MTKQEFIELIGEDPIDVIGNDWENILPELTEEKDFQCPINNCGNPICYGETICSDHSNHSVHQYL